MTENFRDEEEEKKVVCKRSQSIKEPCTSEQLFELFIKLT